MGYPTVKSRPSPRELKRNQLTHRISIIPSNCGNSVICEPSVPISVDFHETVRGERCIIVLPAARCSTNYDNDFLVVGNIGLWSKYRHGYWKSVLPSRNSKRLLWHLFWHLQGLDNVGMFFNGRRSHGQSVRLAETRLPSRRRSGDT